MTCTVNVGLTVSIETDPAAEPYPAAIWIRFSCHVLGNLSAVTFNRSFLCSSHELPLIVGDAYINRTDVGAFGVRGRSTPTTCQNSLICNASDMSGNNGSATWRLGQVTGAAVFDT